MGLQMLESDIWWQQINKEWGPCVPEVHYKVLIQKQ